MLTATRVLLSFPLHNRHVYTCMSINMGILKIKLFLFRKFSCCKNFFSWGAGEERERERQKVIKSCRSETEKASSTKQSRKQTARVFTSCLHAIFKEWRLYSKFRHSIWTGEKCLQEVVASEWMDTDSLVFARSVGSSQSVWLSSFLAPKFLYPSFFLFILSPCHVRSTNIPWSVLPMYVPYTIFILTHVFLKQTRALKEKEKIWFEEDYRKDCLATFCNSRKFSENLEFLVRKFVSQLLASSLAVKKGLFFKRLYDQIPNLGGD